MYGMVGGVLGEEVRGGEKGNFIGKRCDARVGYKEAGSLVNCARVPLKNSK